MTAISPVNPPSELRLRRFAAGLTLKELSIRTFIDTGDLSRIERGLQTPKADTLDRILIAISDAERWSGIHRRPMPRP